MTNSSRLSALCDQIIEAGWLAAVVLVPLFFNIHSSRVFEPDKITLLRSIAVIMAAAWLVRTIEEWTARRRGRSDAAEPAGGERSLFNGVNLRTPLILPTLLLVIVYLIATVLSVAPRTSLLGGYQRLQGTYTTFSYIVIFLLVVQTMRRRRQLDRLVMAIVITSLPIAFYGVLQRCDRDPLPWGGDVTQRVAGNMGNPIFIAAYLIMAFFLTLGRILEAFRVILTEEESRVSDILRASAYIFVAAVQLIAFSFAGSRGPLLGWLPGTFIFGLVGLLMLRVRLHGARQAASANGAPVEMGGHNVLSGLDVIKALGLAVVSLAVAGGAFLLARSAFICQPETPIELAIVAALIGGLVPLLILAGARRSSARWLWAAWILFSIVVAAGLVLVNFSDHPWLAEQRTEGTFGQLATLFESETGTGKVRNLIWEGSVELVRARDQIVYPDGAPDSLNPIRPIVGYGPESMYVAYNKVYPPDLAHYEARNASPDRSHNETWDSLVITGGMGFLAEQFLFLSAFFFALKIIGWVPNRKAAITLVALMALGGAAGAIALGIFKGVNFMGTGWPGGVTAGLVLYVTLFALFHFQISPRVYGVIAGLLILIADLAIFGVTFTSLNRIPAMLLAAGLGAFLLGLLYFAGRWAFAETAGQPIVVSGHVFLIIALFGGILAHYLEISLAGIAIASTRTYFWTFAGLLVVTGLNWVPADDAEPQPQPALRPAPAAPSKTPPTNVPRHKKRRAAEPMPARPQPRPSISRTAPNWLGPTVALALVTALVLVTLGYNYLNTPPTGATACAPQEPPRTVSDVLSNSLTRMSYRETPEECSSPGILLMVIVTWLFGAVVSLTELRRRDIVTPGNQLRAVLVFAGASLTVAFVYWVIHASHLLGVLDMLRQINTPASSLNAFVDRFIALAEEISGLLGLFYLAVFGLIAFTGLSLIGETRARALPLAGSWGMFACAPVFAIAVALLIGANFNPIRGNIVFKQGEPYVANNACNGAGEQLSQCDIAVAHLKQALAYAPDEDFYMLALGASYLQKAFAKPDTPPFLIEASTYDSITRLDAEQTARFGRRDGLAAARATLEHARQVNPLNTDHSRNLGVALRYWSYLAANEAERQQRLEQSSTYYQQATTLSPHNAQLWNEWSIIFGLKYDLAIRQGDTAGTQAALQEAQNRLEESLRLDKEFSDTYIYLAGIHTAQGRTEEAQAAFAEAGKLVCRRSGCQGPDNEMEAALLETLRMDVPFANITAWSQLADGYLAANQLAEAERVTVDILNRHPDFIPGWRTLIWRILNPQGRLQEAVDAARRSVEMGGNDPNHWQDQLGLAQLLQQTGSITEALTHAQAALDGAPADRKADVQQVLDMIRAALSGS